MIHQVVIALALMAMLCFAVCLTAYGHGRPPFVVLSERSRLAATGLFVCLLIVYAQVLGYPTSLVLCAIVVGINVGLGTWRRDDG